MQYNARIKEVFIDEYEGNLILNIGDLEFIVSYFAPSDFIRSLLVESCLTRVIDLWLVYGEVKKSDSKELKFPISNEIAGGIVRGKVIEIFSKNELRIDSGFIIDIESENDVELEVGEFIETTGTYKIFFPGTDFEKN